MSEPLTVVGVSNVGRPLVMDLALAMLRAGDAGPPELALVDPGVVDARGIGIKGFAPGTDGISKVAAAKEAVRAAFGDRVAERIRAYPVSIQSAPGLLLGGRCVFSCVDTLGDACWISEVADGWQCRVSTGRGGGPLHQVQVIPAGSDLRLGDLYSEGAWRALLRRHDCLTGAEGPDPGAGSDQPSGAVAAALAFAAWAGRSREPGVYRLALDGCRPERAEGPVCGPGGAGAAEDLACGYGEPLRRVFELAAGRLTTDADRVLLGFDAPLVARRCRCRRDPYVGFERYPVRAACGACETPRVLLDSTAETTLDALGPIGDRDLRRLGAPAGMRVRALARDARTRWFRLPFQAVDIPRADWEEGP